jgi:cation transport regulator ChaB
MPKDKPKDKSDTDLPSTLERSDEHAQRTWQKTHDSAVETYGEGERAHRTAFSSLKHSYEKVGDHWESKDQKGPSDEQAERGAGDPVADTHEGVDANASKDHLQDLAKRLDVKGRSSMNKEELVEAIEKANRRATTDARRP